MSLAELNAGLTAALPDELASDIVSQFMAIKTDVAARILERSAPGKFVESTVQILQFLDAGNYDANPRVDDYLKNLETRSGNLSDDLRITLPRVARSMYTIRNKRNIAHKGVVDPNVYDLRYLLAGAQWLLSEIVRSVVSIDMESAGRLVEFIQLPVDALVEDFGGRRLVLGHLAVKDEILIVIRYYYPGVVEVSQIHKDMDRHPRSTVSNALAVARRQRLIEGSPGGSYKLTSLGYNKANEVTARALSIAT